MQKVHITAQGEYTGAPSNQQGPSKNLTSPSVVAPDHAQISLLHKIPDIDVIIPICPKVQLVRWKSQDRSTEIKFHREDGVYWHGTSSA
jgi:hypothetical protein